ncbi:hypothetical protein A9Q99_26310 [Gammaproteobacteria bacterium 45_16_T64]|nr:hypothetical protein A9Q99_26310 [Gammaproteobacteria bacterium 45_16_T64]
MPLHFLFRVMTISTLALLAPACGGGGGGGGEGGNDAGSGSDAFVRTQNEYMPLSAGTSIEYDDTSVSAVTLDTGDFNGQGVYAIASGELTLYVSSTEGTISLHGIDGDFEVAGATITKLRFTGSSTSLPIYSSESSEGETVDVDNGGTIDAVASVSLGGLGFNPVIDIEVTSIYNDISLALDYGNLPAREVALSFVIDDTILPGTAFEQAILYNFTDTLSLTQGIGIAKRSFASNDLNINHEIESLTGLPRTIWFNNDTGSPSIAPGSDATFSIDLSTISSNTYKIANQAEINALGWITVQENESSETFNVELHTHDDLPTTLTSVEVIFENIATGARLSGNVTVALLK